MPHPNADAPNSLPALPSEEPNLVQEDSVPSDGRDIEGEKMMDEINTDKPG